MHCAKCFFYERDVGDETCQRCGRAYAPEANVYLGLMVLVTGALAWTLRCLLSGDASPFVRPDLDLGAWATWPVSIVERPAYGFVIGAFLGMLAVAPILTGMMYGKRGGWLLVVIIALVGPTRVGASFWMLVVPTAVFAGALGLGVWIAGGQTIRLNSKLASALLGLVPPAAYWFIETGRSSVETLAPALMSVTYVAPVTAVGFGAAAAAAAVAVGRASRWHIRWPGVLVAVLTAGPLLALPAFVGVDEIRYGLLSQYKPIADAPPAPDYLDRLEEFLARHPQSPRAAEMRARFALALETNDTSDNGPRNGRPSPETLWREILEQHPDSPWAIDAGLHLGDAAAGQGLFDEAERYYRQVLSETAVIEVPDVDPLAEFALLRDLLTIGQALRVREVANHLLTVRRDTRMHLALLLANRSDAEEDSRALALYFRALARKGSRRYRALLEARSAGPPGLLADNIAYDLAVFEANQDRRLELLEEVAAAYPGTDGAMQAHLEAAKDLIDRAAKDPGAWRCAQAHLLAALADLNQRRAGNPEDPYVAALANLVSTKLSYVQAQLRIPEDE